MAFEVNADMEVYIIKIQERCVANPLVCTGYNRFGQYKAKTEVPRDFRNSKVPSSGDIGLNIRTLASPKVGQDQVSGGVSVLCWHAAPVANVLWKPLAIR